MSIDLMKFLERSAFHYDRETLDIVDEDAMFVASLGRPSLFNSTDTRIHAQGRVLAAASELRRCLEELMLLYRSACPENRQESAVIRRAEDVLNSFFDES
ncbi:MAG: hypothetical protein WEB58_02970 [Planctomycetaceae bacterium]